MSASVAVAVALSVLSCGCGDPAPAASRPASTSQPTSDPTDVVPVGFERRAVVVSRPDGESSEWSFWLAGSAEQWHRGLTGVTDLGDAAGMVFVFDEAAKYRFYMWRTPLPLDIAFFDANGEFVGSAEMVPCVQPTSSTCPRHAPDVAILTAIEVPAGSLEQLDLGPGTRISVAGAAD